jgi:cell division protein FtsQ
VPKGEKGVPRGVKKILSKLGLRKSSSTLGRWFRRSIPFALLLVLAVGAFLWVHKSLYAARFMELKGVQIIGLEKLTANEIVKHAHLKKGINLLEMDLDRLVKSVLEHPRVRTVKFKKVFPNRLEIYLEERKPVLQIYVPENKLYYLLDQDGVLLPAPSIKPFEGFLIYSDVSARPVPKMEGEYYPSERIGKITDFLKQANNNSILEEEKIRKVEVDEIGFWRFITEGGIHFRVGDELENLRKIEGAELMLNSDVRGNIDYLDLRFKDVIVKVKKK